MKLLPSFSFFVILLVLVITGSVASSVMASLIYLLGIIVCSTIDNPRTKKYALAVFSIVFIGTTLIILIRYGYLVNNYDSLNIFRSGGDEHDFYEIANDARSFRSISDVFNDVFFVSFLENQGYIFYLRMLSYISYKWFDGNHIVLQMLGSSIFGCMLSISLFKILACYIDERKAFVYTIIGFFLSPFFYYSFMLLRDIHVAYIFSIMTYIVMKPYQAKGVLLLVLLITIAFFLRMESGMLSMFFLLIYVYMKSKSKLLVVSGLAVVAIATIFYTAAGAELIEEALEVNEHYMNRTEDMAESSSALVSLPHPAREVAMFVVHHFVGAAAMWKEYKEVDGAFPFMLVSILVLYRAFWLVLFILIFKWLFINRRIFKMDSTIKWLFFIAMVVELANTSQLEIRRVMCVFPTFYLIFVILKEKSMSKMIYQRDLAVSCAYYLTISALFILTKF